MSDPNNPFQLVYDTLWSMLEEDSRFSDSVKDGNRLNFNKNDRSPMKTQMSTSDYPEVALITEAVTGNLCNTSSTSMLIRNYSWVISTGDFRYKEMFPVEWAIFTGMLAWRERLSTLKWNDAIFVTQANVVSTNVNQIESAQRRGISGWVSVWTIMVEMHFANVLLSGTHLP